MNYINRITLLLVMVATCVMGSAVQAQARSLIVAVPSLPPTLEPMGENANRLARITYSIFETLIRLDQFTGEMKPGLAESWKRIDARTVEFKLRKGVKFHDGNEMTAEDVVFSFGPERFLAEQAPGRILAAPFLGVVEKVEAIDPYTVRVTANVADPLLEKRFSTRMSEIISQKAYLAAGGWDKWSQKPVGTGPYKIATFALSNRLELERFDGYWDTPAPADKLSFIEVSELSARMAGLRSGEFDIITELAPDQMATLSNVKNIEVVGGPVENIYGLVFDTKSSPTLRDPRIRQAISHAIDRKAIVDALFMGRTTVANSWQMKTFGNMYIPEMDKEMYDPELAKKLVKESGYKGEPIVWRLLPGYYTLEVSVTQAIEQMLHNVGLNIKLEIKENWEQVEAQSPTRMINNASVTGYYQDPVGQLWRRFKPVAPWRKKEFFTMPERFDQLGTILESSVDLKERQEAFKGMLKEMAANPTATPLYMLPMFYAKKADFQWKAGVMEFMDFSARNLHF
ncbi:ABC transporter substrate-binding protein [Serratia sp. DD3]|uniref:ABC transporter substrate-binding protein n=1 Tax=Serratia sp. DD3 TaxID=1410619 RepID=UPI0003C4E5D0|nr:ABC transporter substrate-binding protein [Serratia sp. DD3]KEY60904.1 periplasmic dipeptide transport protein [Serratia sp. DD3]